MNSDVYAIKCDCNTNIDIDGTYTKDDMQEECRELGIPKDSWMSYLFSHLFSDYKEWNSEIEDTFMNNDSITQMHLVMDADRIVLTKIFR